MGLFDREINKPVITLVLLGTFCSSLKRVFIL